MASMNTAVVTLLFLSALHQIASANHCPAELTKPNQVIDIDKSKDLKQFDDIGALHVDGDTEEERMKECVNICCHAGAGCNVVSLDKSIEGRDGDNCQLFKCDPPEDCKWTVKDGFQSALLSPPITTTVPSVETTSVSDTNTKESTTEADSDSTTTDSSGITTDSTEITTAKSKNETQYEATTEATATTEASDVSDGTTTESLTYNGTTTEDSQNTTAESLTYNRTTTEDSQNTTEASVSKASDNSDNSTETTTVKPKRMVTDPGEMNSTDFNGNSTTEAPLNDTITTTRFRTTTAAVHSTTTDTGLETTSKKRAAVNSTATPSSKEDTTILIQSTNTNVASTTPIGETAFYGNDTQTPAALRAKTADMSSNTVTALACALATGAMFVGIIATVIGKRFYDNWHRRHYQQIDYLVDGM